MPSRWAKLLLGLILLVGFLLRLTHLVEAWRAPDFFDPQFESQYHDYWARSLVTGDWQPPAGVTDPEIRSRPYFRPPGYPFFLAAVYRALGLDPLIPRLVQMLLGLGTVVLLYRLIIALMGPSRVVTALSAAAIVASSWILIFFESELMEPTVLSFLLLALLNLAIESSSTNRASPPAARSSRRAQAFMSVGIGLLIGVISLIRPNALVLAPIFLVAQWYRGTATPRTVRLQRCALLLVTILGCLAPTVLRNLAVSGQPVVVSCNGGINLFIGLHPDSDGFTPGVPELGALTGLEGWDSFDWPKIVTLVADRFDLQPHSGERTADRRVARFFTERAIQNLARDPVGTTEAIARKVVLFWGPDEVSNNKILSMEQKHSRALSRGPDFSTVLALALLGSVLLGAHLGQPKSTRFEHPKAVSQGVIVIGATILGLSLSYLPFFASARFRAPLIPLLALFSGYAVDCFVRWVQRKHWKKSFKWLAGALVLWMITSTSWAHYEEDESTWHWRRALLFQRAGERVQAIYELEQALGISPNRSEARLALADILTSGTRAEQQRAVFVYRELISRSDNTKTTGGEPDQVQLVALNNLAALLAGPIGDLDGAIDCWQQVIEIEPERLPSQFNLAIALTKRAEQRTTDRERERDLRQAARLVSAARSRIDPADADLHRALLELDQRINLQLGHPSNAEER